MSENKSYYYCAFIWTLLSHNSYPPHSPSLFSYQFDHLLIPKDGEVLRNASSKTWWRQLTTFKLLLLQYHRAVQRTQRKALAAIFHICTAHKCSRLASVGVIDGEKESMPLPPPTKLFCSLGSRPWIAVASSGSNSWSLDDRVNAFHCATWQPTTSSLLFIVFSATMTHQPTNYQLISFYFIYHLFHKIFFSTSCYLLFSHMLISPPSSSIKNISWHIGALTQVFQALIGL